MNMRDGLWRNGNRVLRGKWCWNWARQRFEIVLDSIDPITGQVRKVEVSGEAPEWGKWKLIATGAANAR